LNGVERSRAFEERVIDLCHRKLLGGFVDIDIGKEGVAVCIAITLREDDYLYGTARSHGHFLARGTGPNLLMAELADKDTYHCRHLMAAGRRLMSATGSVGGTIPLALGTAFLAREQGAVVAVFFRDGACNAGSFHECLNGGLGPQIAAQVQDIALKGSTDSTLVCSESGHRSRPCRRARDLKTPSCQTPSGSLPPNSG
jgi:TPP-dependent pyruvate/acetoin dehydrogenase alpha subunit